MSIQETEPLPPAVVASLYRGAVAVGGAAPAAVLCGARLGLSPAALRHLHADWVDWRAGRLRVPVREPCVCRDCCETARSVAADSAESPLAVLYDRCFQPPHGGRTVSFGWSRRLTAVLAHTLDRRQARGHAHDGRPFERGLAAAADAAEGVDPTGVDFRRLRATAAAGFARAGVASTTLAALLGTDEATARAVVRRHGTAAADALAARCGATPPDGLSPERFPLVADPTPVADEPFDPRSFDAAWRRQRADDDGDRRLSNPRPSDVPPETDYDPGRHGAAYRNYDDHVRQTDAGPVSTLPTRLDGAGSDTDATVTAPTGGGPAAPADDGLGSDGTEAGEPDGTDETDTSRDEEPVAPETDETDPPEAPDGAPRLGPGAGAASVTPPDRVSGPVAFDETVRVAVAELNGGQPTDARVVLGEAELLVAADETVQIPLSAVVDVAVDYVPDGMDDVFEDTVAVVYRRDGSRRLAVGEFPGRRQVDAADALFEALLAGETVLVTHPARVGGRVTDERPRSCTVVPEGRRLVFRADGETVTTVEPRELIHAERGRQRVADGGGTRKAVKVRHRDDGDPVTTEFGAETDRLFRVLERRITHDYRRREERLRDLDLSDEETETLVALYSAGDEVDVGMLLDVDPDGLGRILESLADAGLVDLTGEAPGLTAMGETAVSERLDDVNV